MWGHIGLTDFEARCVVALSWFAENLSVDNAAVRAVLYPGDAAAFPTHAPLTPGCDGRKQSLCESAVGDPGNHTAGS